ASRTTITYGLRWDIAPPPAGTNGHSLLALSSLQSLSTLAFAPPGTALWKTDYKDFAPRIGIAHQIRNTPNWSLVVRTGAGTFYALAGGSVGNEPTNPPNSASRALSAGTAFPYTANAITFPSLPASPPYASAVGMDPDLKTARVYQWNLALEQEVGAYGS